MEIHHIDVDQGDSTLIIVKKDEKIVKTALIDCGSHRYHLKLIVDYMNSLGIMKLNYIIISHTHKDHMGGSDNLSTFWVKIYNTFLKPGYIDSLDSIILIDSKKQWAYKSLNVGEEIFNIDPNAPNDPNVPKMYYLNGNLTGITALDENLNSLAFLVQINNFKYYTAGDLPTDHEDKKILQALYPYLPITAFKLSHHGSDSSTSDKFLREIKPMIGFISCGDRYNTDAKPKIYDHPNIETLNRMEKTESIEKYWITNMIVEYEGDSVPDDEVYEAYINKKFNKALILNKYTLKINKGGASSPTAEEIKQQKISNGLPSSVVLVVGPDGSTKDMLYRPLVINPSTVPQPAPQPEPQPETEVLGPPKEKRNKKKKKEDVD